MQIPQIPQVPTIERRDDIPAHDSWSGSAPGSTRLEAIKAPLAGFVLAGTLLTLVTLGIYRFWYRTGIRRYYWNNTRLGGDGFEYTGTGRELFVGFLIALAIILPIYLIVTLIGLFGGRLVGPIIASVVAAVIMPALIQVLSYRARRYRLTRTRFRGVRFHQSGSGTGYLLRTVKWLILTALTLGIVFPYLRRALEAYKIENTWFGSAQARFAVEIRPLMRTWLAFWGFVVLALGMLALVPFSTAVAQLAPLTVTVLGLIVLPLRWVTYRVREFRAFTTGTSCGGLTLASDLRAWPVIRVWLGYYLAMLGLGLAFAAMVAALFAASGRFPTSPAAIEEYMSGLGPIATVYGIALVGFILGSVVTEIALRRRLWALRIGSVNVANIGALDTVVQGAAQDATGIAEAFDSGFDIAG